MFQKFSTGARQKGVEACKLIFCMSSGRPLGFSIKGRREEAQRLNWRQIDERLTKNELTNENRNCSTHSLLVR